MPIAVDTITSFGFVAPLLAVAFGLVVVAICTRKKPPPGKLQVNGEFNLEDPANAEAILERQRDFLRIASTKRDIWIFSETDTKPGIVLPIDTSAAAGDNSSDAVQPAVQKLKFFLQERLGKIPGAIDLGLTSQWPVVDRVAWLISVTPGFDFAMRHQVQPMLLQPKYLLLISKTGQVRVAWYAFATDKPVPGATAGPFVLKLVSEDLNAERERTWTTFKYTARATRVQDMEAFIAQQAPLIMKGINSDKWDPYTMA